MFNNSHDFYIKNLYASDGAGSDLAAIALLDKLVNAACLGAGHQSDERHDAPKCHPETREAVIKDIMSWVNDKDSNEPIMWVSGPAGAGKSAIAQTVCEKCFEENKLLASFFFSRTATASGRSEAKRLVPTIACQLAIAIPGVKQLIIQQLNNDSTTLTYSMETQIRRLVLEPLAAMYTKVEQDKSSIAQDVRTPYVVVIDGLDECNDPKDQSRIVRMISTICGTQGQIQLRFFIASRPELEIRNAFELIIERRICAQIVLNEDYSPDDDIQIYLHSEFDILKREHTLRKTLQQESDWPSSGDIEYLVGKSSGQFIYASTVMKYLGNPRRDPRQGLRAIQVNTDVTTMQISNAPQNESPYTPLDLLYRHILGTSSAGYDTCKIIFQILLFAYQNTHSFWEISFSPTLDVLSSFTGMTPLDLELLLADFHSILYIPNCGEIWFYHASFGDFLKDTSRSGNFYISRNEAHYDIAQHCLSIILDIPPEIGWDKLNLAQRYTVDRFFEHLQDSHFDEKLLTMLRSETTLRAVLDVLSKYQLYNSLTHVIKFSFDGQRIESQPYWTPWTDKIQDICLAVVKLVEERFLFRIGLNGHDVMQGLYNKEDIKSYISYYPALKYYFDWLLFLLESPIHGKQIYLNSKNSFILYKKLIQETDRDTRRQYGHGTDTCYPLVLKYLLMRIQPSAAYTDSDLFPRASEEVLNEIIRGAETYDRPEREQFIKDLHSATETFLKKCQELKKQEEEEMKRKQEEDVRRQQEEELKQKKEEEMKRQQEEELKRKQEEELRWQREEELKCKQEEDLRRQQEEELKRKHEEEFRRQKEEQLKLKQQQEEQQTKRSFRNRLMSPIKNVQRKLKDKLR